MCHLHDNEPGGGGLWVTLSWLVVVQRLQHMMTDGVMIDWALSPRLWFYVEPVTAGHFDKFVFKFATTATS